MTNKHNFLKYNEYNNEVVLQGNACTIVASYVFCFYSGAHTTTVISLSTISFSGTMQVAAFLLELAFNIFYNLVSTVLSMTVTITVSSCLQMDNQYSYNMVIQ